MKKLVLLLVLAGMIPCFADIPVDKDDLLSIYGPTLTPDGDEMLRFHSEGVDIKVYSAMSLPPVKIYRISFSRSTAFNDAEIDQVLKPISAGETWVRKDNRTWILPEAKVTAKWDGEGKVTVTPGVPSK